MIETKSLRTLISESALKVRIEELGSSIRKVHGNSPIVCICVLKGDYFFAADLIRSIAGDVRIEFLHITKQRHPTEFVPKVKYISGDVFGKRCVLIYDILDTGHSLASLMKYVRGLKPKSLCSAVLLEKPGNREVKISADFTGFSIPDEFVVGYGLGFQDKFRNLDHIAAYTP